MRSPFARFADSAERVRSRIRWRSISAAPASTTRMNRPAGLVVYGEAWGGVYHSPERCQACGYRLSGDVPGTCPVRDMPKHTHCVKCRYHVDITTSIKPMDGLWRSAGVLRHVQTSYTQQAAAVDVWGRSGRVVGALVDNRSENEGEPPSRPPWMGLQPTPVG